MTDYYNLFVNLIANNTTEVVLVAAFLAGVWAFIRIKRQMLTVAYIAVTADAKADQADAKCEQLADMFKWTWGILVEEGIMIQEVIKDDDEERVTAFNGRKRAAAKKKADKAAA